MADTKEGLGDENEQEMVGYINENFCPLPHLKKESPRAALHARSLLSFPSGYPRIWIKSAPASQGEGKALYQMPHQGAGRGVRSRCHS